MPTVREYEAAMERNAADTEAFVALRKAYRQAQKHDRLVTLYEARAQAIEDNAKAGELFYLAAELRIDQLGDAEGAEADLVNAVDRDPSHIRAAARLKDIYREQGRTADYMTMLEMEAAAVARTRDPARIAELEAEMSQLFLNHFARLERAVRNPQRAGASWRRSTSGRSSRRGRSTARSATTGRSSACTSWSSKGRRTPAGGPTCCWGSGACSARSWRSWTRRRSGWPRSSACARATRRRWSCWPAFYANPNWIGADGAERAAAIYYQLARRRQEAGDVENAIAALRRALAAVPGHPESSELLERVYYEARRFQDLDRYYRERVQTRRPAEAERIDFLYKRAQLSEGELEDVAEAQRVYNEISLLEPAGRSRVGEAGRAVPARPGIREARRAARAPAGRDRGSAAAGADDAGAGGAVPRPPGRSRPGGGLPARGAGDRAREPDGAGAPTPSTSARRATGRRWPICWSSRSSARDWRGIGAEELLPRLEEIADRQREAAGRPRARHRGLAARRGDRADVRARAGGAAAPSAEGQELGSPGRPAGTRGRRAGGSRRSARDPAAGRPAPPGEAGQRRARDRDLQGDPQRPTRRTRCRCARVVETYEREGDFVSLANLLREQIDRAGTKQERVGLLRRVLVICDERTGDLAQGQWAATEILQAVPGDRDTLTRLERILERAGKPAELVQVLDQHTKHAANPDEKLAILRRIADIMRGPLQDPPGAAAAPGRSRPDGPGRRERARTLVEIYAGLNRYEDLARVLDLQVERVVADPAQQAEYLRQLARLVEGQLRELRTGAAHLGAAAGPAAQRRRGAGVAGAHLQQPGRLAIAGADHGAADAAGREPEPGRRHRPAARANLRREARTTPTRRRWRSSSSSPRSIRATSSPTSACAATTRPTRTGRASSRSPSGSCS